MSVATYAGGPNPPPPYELCGLGGRQMTMCEDPHCYRKRPHCCREWGCRWSSVAVVGPDRLERNAVRLDPPVSHGGG